MCTFSSYKDKITYYYVEFRDFSVWFPEHINPIQRKSAVSTAKTIKKKRLKEMFKMRTFVRQKK